MQREMPNVAVLRLAGACLVVAFLLSGCGGAATSTAAPVAAPQAAAPSQPTVGGAAAATPGKTPGQGAEKAAATAGTTEKAALKITGKVEHEVTWSEDQVRAMPTAQVTAKNQKGDSSSYDGVPLLSLLKQAGVRADASTVVFVGETGETAQAEWQAVQACAGCLISFRTRGGFSLVMPGFAEGVQLKGLSAIEVK